MATSGAAAKSRVGKYELVRELGRGGMGVVWAARDTVLGRDIALKLIDSDAATDPVRRRRLFREARSLARLNHPAIARVLDFGEADDAVYLAMELEEGELLSDRLASGPLDSVEPIARALADALAAAHEAGIVHRDLKPSNIMIRPDGDPVLLDFGIARVVEASEASDRTATAEGQVIGTPAYMSPEQIRGLRVDERTDVFAFGALLYEMLTGRRPFERDSQADSVLALLTEEPEALPESIEPQLIAVVDRCLAKEAGDRFADGGALVAGFDEPVLQARPGRPWLAFIGVAGLVAVVTSLWIYRQSADLSAASEPGLGPTPSQVETMRSLADKLVAGGNDFVAISTAGVLVASATGQSYLKLTNSSDTMPIASPFQVVGASALPNGTFVVGENAGDRTLLTAIDPRDGSRIERWNARTPELIAAGSMSVDGEVGAFVDMETLDLVTIARRDGSRVVRRIQNDGDFDVAAIQLSPSGNRLAWFETAGSGSRSLVGRFRVAELPDGSTWTVPEESRVNPTGPTFVAFAGESHLIYARYEAKAGGNATASLWSRALLDHGRIGEARVVPTTKPGHPIYGHAVGDRFVLVGFLEFVQTSMSADLLAGELTSVRSVESDAAVSNSEGERVDSPARGEKRRGVACSRDRCIRARRNARTGEVTLSWDGGSLDGQTVAVLGPGRRGHVGLAMDDSGSTVFVPRMDQFEIVNTTDGSVTRHTASSGAVVQHAAYDPSRDSFVVTGIQESDYVVLRVDRDGSSRVIGRLGGWAYGPKVSPDGSRLTFGMQRMTKRFELVEVPE